MPIINTKIMKKLIFPAIIATSLLCLFYAFFHSSSDKQTLLWGDEYVTSSEIEKVLDTPVMKRLKDIDQSGAARYFGPKLPKFSRYDHSIGVWALLKKTGADLKEQIAGLLHDTSHTVFSHIGDHIFAKNANDFTQRSYQDTIHMAFLKKNKLINIVSAFGLTPEDLDPEKKEYKRLEQPLPDMCADRIQYNIHTGLLLGVISKEDAKAIFDNIKFENGKWFFTDKDLAKKFAKLSVYFTQNFWGSKWNVSLDIHFANALKRAIKLKLVLISDLFLTDNVIMTRLLKNQDRILQLNIYQCKHPLEKIPGKKYKSIFFKPKFRGIDPLMRVEGSNKLVRLTSIDVMFKHYYDSVKEWCYNGFDVEILDVPIETNNG